MRALSVALAAAAIVFLVDGLPTKNKDTTKQEIKKLLKLLKEVEKSETKDMSVESTTTLPTFSVASSTETPSQGEASSSAPQVYFQRKIGKSKPFKTAIANNGEKAARTYCPTTYMGGDQGGFSSINRGYGDYTNNLDCTWIITGDVGETISLSFDYFDTEYYWDPVSVYDGNSASSYLMGSISGDLSADTPIPVTSSGNSLTVVFTSDGSVTSSGFSASYTITSSGGSAPSPSPSSSPSASPSTGGGSTSSYADACTYAHNNVRRRHGVPDMTWSSSLASESQIWADELADTGSFYHDPNNNDGENLYVGTVGVAGNEYECSDAVFGWYDEVNNPGYNFNNPGFSSGTGHFTQVVWENSVNVGCATATRESGGSSTSTVVCRYDPPGNYNNDYAENVPQLTSGNSYPTSHRDLEENPCHDKSSDCSDGIRYGWCSTYDFFADVCWSSCGMC